MTYIIKRLSGVVEDPRNCQPKQFGTKQEAESYARLSKMNNAEIITLEAYRNSFSGSD